MGSATMKMDISSTFKNAIALVSNPVSYMKDHKDATLPVNTVMINYVAVLAAIPFIATLIGDLWYYARFGVYGYAVVAAIVTYILDVAAVFIIGMVIWKLAPTFGTTTDQSRATMLAAYVFTPVFLISILNVIPFIGWITFVGLLYGLYILYLGIPILFNIAASKVISYTIGIVVASFVVLAIVGAIVGAISVLLFI
ncbi:MAG: YIP1 family protein [Thaumarchaeota archaeon]|nr:YIP1 family protein [Nitrososphaerota archaeon]